MSATNTQRRGPYLNASGGMIGGVSAGLRLHFSGLAQDVFPAKRRRYALPPGAISRARNHGWPFAETAAFMRAAGPEGAQKIAAALQSVADSTASEEALCIERLNREAVHANATDIVQTTDWTPGCSESTTELVEAILKDLAVDRLRLVALGRHA